MGRSPSLLNQNQRLGNVLIKKYIVCIFVLKLSQPSLYNYKFRQLMENQFFFDQAQAFNINYLPQSKTFSYQQYHEKVTIFIKNIKNDKKSPNSYGQSFHQIKKVANLLMSYLSQDKIKNHIVYFQVLASLDSLLSTFKLSLYTELDFDKVFYRNIQKQFQQLCLNLQTTSKEHQHHILQFQLYSVFYLIVMLIYFSGKNTQCNKQKIPLKIMTKPFINSLLTLSFQMTQKNQRIISLILAYLAKNINLKIYGERMLKFIMEHFHQVKLSKTFYHFIYSLREIHLQRQISLKIVIRYQLVQKLMKVLVDSFFSSQSLYIVDYLNLLLIKHPILCQKLENQQFLDKLSSLDQINELSILHQDLLLQIQMKLTVNPKNQSYFRSLYERCFTLGHKNDYCLKVLMQLIGYLNPSIILLHIQLFLQNFKQICDQTSIKGVLFGLQIFSKILVVLSSCHNKFLISYLKQATNPMLNQIRSLSFCRKELKLIQYMIEEMISIQNVLI